MRRSAIRKTNGKIGSIGAHWPLRVDRKMTRGRSGAMHGFGNDRVKGFANMILNSENIQGVLRDVEQEKNGFGTTRATFRAIVDPQAFIGLEELTQKHGFRIEAIIPLGPKYNNQLLVYFGNNSEERTASQEIISMQKQAVTEIAARKIRSQEQILQVVNSNGYVVDNKVDTSNGDVERLVQLYGDCLPIYLFELDPQAIKDIFENPDNKVSVIRNHGQIISVAIAETTVVDVEGMQIPLAELSECATDPEYRGQGLMTAILQTLITDLNPGTIIYSESRAPHDPINVAMRSNGLDYAGTLHKHCVIGEHQPAEGEGPYSHMENFNIWSRVK